MPLSRDELEAQRAMIQKHLDWIDLKISETDGQKNAPAENQKLPGPDIKNTLAVEPPLAYPSRSDPVSAGSDLQCSGETEPSTLTDPGTASFETSGFKENTENDIIRARYGCIFIFIAATAAVLFFFFGLPYFL